MAPSRDRLLIGAAAILTMVGFLAWWRAPSAVIVPVPIRSLLALWLSAGGIATALVWLSAPRSPRVRAVIAALTLAATAPLSAVPLVSSLDGRVAQAGMGLAAVAVVPMGLLLSTWIARPEIAQAVRIGFLTAVAVAVFTGLLAASGDGSAVPALGPTTPPSALVAVRWVALAGGIVAVAAAAAASILRDPRVALGSQARILTALGLVAVGIGPGATGLALAAPDWQFFIVPILAAATTAALLARSAIGPLARVASTATAQRDLVMAALEAERSRLASALHDGPLGDIALLVQRLDEAGDVDSAAIARSIASDLRVIGNDLRLPTLEDLGAGPALEWLVDRVSTRAGAAIRLELEEDLRPPPAVELAVYRVAQEALVNAIKHGRPPVMVRYVATADAASLSVEDAGPGMSGEAQRRAVREGRLGLMSMAQRAEAIGGKLILASREGGGTRIDLEWTAAAG